MKSNVRRDGGDFRRSTLNLALGIGSYPPNFELIVADERPASRRVRRLALSGEVKNSPGQPRAAAFYSNRSSKAPEELRTLAVRYLREYRSPYGTSANPRIGPPARFNRQTCEGIRPGPVSSWRLSFRGPARPFPKQRSPCTATLISSEGRPALDRPGRKKSAPPNLRLLQRLLPELKAQRTLLCTVDSRYRGQSRSCGRSV